MVRRCNVTVLGMSNQRKEQEGRSGGKIERKLSEVNTKAVSGGQNLVCIHIHLFSSG